ncbi:hypothetical protein GS4_41_00560 [Gordonia soli NBRC 108243]|uniref:Uncharacterized protein n=2 Tax=Gordonia soli TaxID=320799 RepID=M0QQF0_9ACTN|nr:hypothetical protein GS4_41_00560 [Gordonia soli NBRC 108243]
MRPTYDELLAQRRELETDLAETENARAAAVRRETNTARDLETTATERGQFGQHLSDVGRALGLSRTGFTYADLAREAGRLKTRADDLTRVADVLAEDGVLDHPTPGHLVRAAQRLILDRDYWRSRAENETLELPAPDPTNAEHLRWAAHIVAGNRASSPDVVAGNPVEREPVSAYTLRMYASRVEQAERREREKAVHRGELIDDVAQLIEASVISVLAMVGAKPTPGFDYRTIARESLEAVGLLKADAS